MIANSKAALILFGMLVVVVSAYIISAQEKVIPVVVETTIPPVNDTHNYDYVLPDISPTSTPQSIVPIDKTNAFDAAPRSMSVSNVVGYFASGAFVISVPEWLVQHWTSTSTDTFGSMAFLPREDVEGVDFSRIEIYIRPTDELFNAEWLFTEDKKDEHVATDTYLNLAEDMKIYYINSVRGNRTYLTFYADGNNKTARITFNAANKNADKYIPKIKELVSNIGTGRRSTVFDK